MKFVTIDSDYLKEYNKLMKKTHKEFGLSIYHSESGRTIFIPITSYKNKHSTISKHDSKYHILIDKRNESKAVLKISDYVIVGKYSNVCNIQPNSIEQSEFGIIKKDEDKIRRKLNDNLRNKKRFSKEIELYEDYEALKSSATRKFSENYINEILYSITLFEDLDVTPQNIEEIINLSENKINISGHDNMILTSAINSWKWVLDTLDKQIDLDYLIDLNRRIAEYQALKVGVLRDGEGGYVKGSTYNPPIPIKKNVKTELELLEDSSNKINAALEYFCYATKNQLFYDGNKRTSYLLVNKVLISNGIGVFFISDEKKERFNQLLSEHYNYSHVDNVHKEKLIKYIIDECIIYQ